MKEQQMSLLPGITTAEFEMRKTYLTKDGRPLMENGAEETLVARQKTRGIRIDMITNRYTDSRGNYPERPMNGSAYEKIKADKHAIFDGFAFLNQHYFRDGQPENVTIRNVYELSAIGAWLPSYLVLRAEQPIQDDALPDAVGGMHKAAEGIRNVASKLVQNGQEFQSISPEFMYEAANSLVSNEGTPLVGAHEVCPAPPKLIIDTVAAMGWQQGGSFQNSELMSLITPEEFPRLKAFSIIAVEYMLFSEVTREMYELFPDDQKASLLGKMRNEALDVEGKVNVLLGRDPYSYSEQK